MATQNRIFIAVDPGFHSTKVVVNGVLFKVPNSTVDITGQAKNYLSLNNNRKASGYILSHYIPEKEYLVGELARTSSMESAVRDMQAERHGMMDGVGRFHSTEFEVHLMTCIAMGLIKYAEESIDKCLQPRIDIKDPSALKNAQIIVGVALPNDWVNDAWPVIQKFMTNKHSFMVETELDKYSLDFQIEPGKSMALSQAICALLGVSSSDDGRQLKNCDVINNLPCIVIDGGYKTAGIFELTKALKVTAAESNTDYAMGNVHKNVASILNTEYGRSNIHDFQIPEIIENEDGKINYLEEGPDGKKQSKSVDVKLLVKQEEEAICKQLIEYLNEKFDNLLDIKEVVITGGTGTAYYEHIKKYLHEERGHLAGHVILTKYDFLGRTIDPVYAIAVGMYKTLKNQFHALLRQASNTEGSRRKQG